VAEAASFGVERREQRETGSFPHEFLKRILGTGSVSG
jgi:hypothetical protein